MDQSMRGIDYIKNVAEYVRTADGLVSASQMLERFLFPSHMQYTLIASYRAASGADSICSIS